MFVDPSMTTPPRLLETILRPLIEGAAARAEAVQAALELLERAHAAHPESWLSDEDFVTYAVRHAMDAGGALSAGIASLHAADLYLALACARGVRSAIQVFEREHFANVGDFIARIDSSRALADEVRQRLRSRILVSAPDVPARILGYTGRGSLGGWLRVCAVREAQSMKREGQRERALPEDDLSSDQVDPELVWLKDRYGDAVSEAFKEALGKLEPDHRTMLRMHYVDGLTIEQVGQVFRVSRATAARMLLKARDGLVEHVREKLSSAFGIEEGEAQSILALVRSRIDLSLRRQLS